MHLLRWIFETDQTEGTFNIRHLEPLAHVRSLIPYPAWRVPTVNNFYLAGYANGAEEVPIEEDKAGAA